MVAWLPIVVWAIATDHVVTRAPDESLLAHFGIHARFLIAIPLLVLGEAMMQRVTGDLRDYILRYDLLGDAQIEELKAFAMKLRGLRGGLVPWLVITGLVAAVIAGTPPPRRMHELTWAAQLDMTQLPFGAWWYVYVARTLMLVLGAAAVWRIVLWGALIAKLARLDLNLVPNHPDHVMGLGFIGNAPFALAPFFLAASSLAAATFSHEILYHGAHVKDYYLPIAGLAIIALLVSILPLLTFAPVLGRARRLALKQYGGLLARQGRQIHAMHIEHDAKWGDDVLDPPGIGVSADAATLYEHVKSTNTVPITRRTIIAELLPVAIPMLFLVTTEVPLKQVLVTLLKAMM